MSTAKRLLIQITEADRRTYWDPTKPGAADAAAKAAQARKDQDKRDQFADRALEESEIMIRRTRRLLDLLEGRAKNYYNSISGKQGSWRHSGDFGRINETLRDIVERMEWIEQ